MSKRVTKTVMKNIKQETTDDVIDDTTDDVIDNTSDDLSETMIDDIDDVGALDYDSTDANDDDGVDKIDNSMMDDKNQAKLKNITRTIPPKIRWKISAKQKHRCNNSPGSNIRNLNDFECPLWKNDENPGLFDENGFDVDHIMEFSLTQDNSEENLQALCITCHKEKTRIFNESRFKNIKSVKKNKPTDNKNKKIIKDPKCVKATKKYVCDDCKKIFASRENLNYHIRNKVCENKKFSCKYCENKFASYISMHRHRRLYCKLKPNNADVVEVVDENSDENSDDSVNENSNDSIDENNNELIDDNLNEDNIKIIAEIVAKLVLNLNKHKKRKNKTKK